MPTFEDDLYDDKDGEFNPSKTARHTLWVINNWTPDDLERVREYAKLKAAYMCWSQEVGGPPKRTPHLQGYVHWKSEHSFKKFKKEISKNLHWGDKRGFTNGTAEQNRRYCQGLVKKKGMELNPTFEEVGEVPQQGARTDWVQALSDLKSLSVLATIDRQPHLMPCVRALQTYQQLSLTGTHREVNVIVLVGAPGTGKTRWAWDNYPDLYSKPDGQWWDGYRGQKTVLLDDYDGNVPYAALLKYADRYPVLLPVKGGFVSAEYTTLIITSNQPPSLWYKMDIPAFERRVKTYVNQYITDADEEEPSAPPPPSKPSTTRRTIQAYVPKEIL